MNMPGGEEDRFFSQLVKSRRRFNNYYAQSLFFGGGGPWEIGILPSKSCPAHTKEAPPVRRLSMISHSILPRILQHVAQCAAVQTPPARMSRQGRREQRRERRTRPVPVVVLVDGSVNLVVSAES